jgi:hypothetical protein
MGANGDRRSCSGLASRSALIAEVRSQGSPRMHIAKRAASPLGEARGSDRGCPEPAMRRPSPGASVSASHKEAVVALALAGGLGLSQDRWSPAIAYLNWVLRQASGWRVVVVVGMLLVCVDARAYLGPRPGGGR